MHRGVIRAFFLSLLLIRGAPRRGQQKTGGRVAVPREKVTGNSHPRDLDPREAPCGSRIEAVWGPHVAVIHVWVGGGRLLGGGLKSYVGFLLFHR